MATIEDSLAQAMDAASRAMNYASSAADSAQQSKTWATSQLAQFGFGGLHKGLVVTISGTGYQGTISCQRLVLEGYNNSVLNARNINLTFDAGEVGLNGLDTGAVAAGNWYYIYVISDGTNVASLVSLSNSNPTLPAGFNKFALVGSAYVKTATTNFKPTIKKGNRVYFGTIASDTSEQVAVSSTSNTAIDISKVVPPTATAVTLIAAGTGSASVYVSLANDSNYVIGVSGGSCIIPSDLMHYNTTLYAKSSGTGIVYFLGYVE